MTLDEAIKETAKVLQQYVEGCDEFDAGVQVLAAARSWHTLPPVWEQAHRLRDALLDSFNNHEIRTMAELFELVMDDGVTQAWVRALTDTAGEDQ